MYNMGLNDKIPSFTTFYEMDEHIRKIEKKKKWLNKIKSLHQKKIENMNVNSYKKG